MPSRYEPAQASGTSSGRRSARRRTGSRSASCAPGSSRCAWRTPTPIGTATMAGRSRLTAAEVGRLAGPVRGGMAADRARLSLATPPGLAAGLSTCSCRWPTTCPAGRSARAARQAFGAVGAALPVDGADLALLIIHEFQHVKLGALLDMFDLYDSADQRAFLRALAGGPAAARRPAPGHVRAHRRHRLLAAAPAPGGRPGRARRRRAVRPLADDDRGGDRDAGQLGRADHARHPVRGGHARNRRALAD